MTNPVSTYRLQFHKDFTFGDFEKIIPYLQRLGIGTIYASPIFKATPGSVHGYDGINPHKINPEIGTEEQLLSISKRLHELDIKWLQDIVPNHMAFDPNNKWLKDVLEKGERSVYANFFDVPWTGEIYSGKIMIPFLGDTLDNVIDNGELKVAFEDHRFVFKYYDSSYPIRLRSYPTIIEAGRGEMVQSISQLLEQLNEVKKTEDPSAYREPVHELQLQLTSLLQNDVTKAFIQSGIDEVNNNKDLLKSIADEQVYKLTHWQKTDSKINFRRFFTVNGLICLNMQDEEVFEYFHKYIKHLLDAGVFQGLRVDHIDGLYDPIHYLDQLGRIAGEETYIAVEKILEPGEELPDYWKIQGSTGYDFLSDVNNIFTNKKAEEKFTAYYKQLVNDDRSIHQQLHDKKSFILHEHMGGELTNLHNLFVDLSLADDDVLANVPPKILKGSIAEFLIQCPVYRYYGNRVPLDETEAANVQDIFKRIKESKTELAPAVDLLETALLNKPGQGNEEYNTRALRFYQRCMQFTGPLMAKGVEDTLMYTYNRFIGHNEVGDSPEAFGDGPAEFHRKMVNRQKKWPLAMNGTSTHDTKRGEDVRARLNVLTDIVDQWFCTVEEWRQMNIDLKQNNAPDENDEYLIYQTLIGSYPMPQQGDDTFTERIQEYVQKALREAKTHSNWTTPNEEYETAAKNFAVALLDHSKPFWQSFLKLHRKVADFGIINSLTQTLLKLTCPGLPDIYQGCELWDFSLVDPDNRRPVDYDKREQLLNELDALMEEEHGRLMQHLWDNRYSGKIKLWLVHLLLNERRTNAELFSGEYLPLPTQGEYKHNVLAFARRSHNEWLIVAVPLHFAEMQVSEKSKGKSEKEEGNIQQATFNIQLVVDWKDTTIALPGDAPSSFTLLFSKQAIQHQHSLAVKNIFTSLPLAVLKSHDL